VSNTNREGLTYTEWLRAAGWPFDLNGWPRVGRLYKASLDSAKRAWEAGEDPTDYMADGTFKDCGH
jgi:hypothetical protein